MIFRNAEIYSNNIMYGADSRNDEKTVKKKPKINENLFYTDISKHNIAAGFN